MHRCVTITYITTHTPHARCAYDVIKNNADVTGEERAKKIEFLLYSEVMYEILRAWKLRTDQVESYVSGNCARQRRAIVFARLKSQCPLWWN